MFSLNWTPHAIIIQAWPPCSAVSVTSTLMSEPGVSTGTDKPAASYHFCQTSRPRLEAAELAPQTLGRAQSSGPYLNSWGMPLGQLLWLFLSRDAISFLLIGCVTHPWPATREAKSAKAAKSCHIMLQGEAEGYKSLGANVWGC